MNLAINELEREILKEIVNISLAKAADAFAVIAKEKVLISAPEFQIIEIEKLKKEESLYNEFNIIIESNLNGSVNGKTYLLFSKHQSDKLSEICLGDIEIPEIDKEPLFTSLLLEIGNIITGSLVTQLSNILQVEMFGSVPNLKQNYLGELLNTIEKSTSVFNPLYFKVKTEFVHSDKSLEFPFVLLFDMEALGQVLTIIRKFNNKEGLSNFMLSS